MLWVVMCLPSANLTAQMLMDDVPASAKAIEVEDRVGEFIPLDLVFADERGNKIALGRFFKRNKPIVLTLNYSDCPGLCVAQLDSLVSTLRELDGAGIGERFEMVTVSIDPTERPSKAAATKQKYVGMLSGTQASEGWHFLTGDQKSITELAKSVGFHYAYDKASKRYSHAAVTYFLSEDGRICRYFLSLGEEPAQFKFALSDAGAGKLAESLSDSFVQMCYSYNPDANRYTADARWLLSFSAGAFVLLVLGFTAPFWFSWRSQTGGSVVPSEEITVRSGVKPSQVVANDRGLADPVYTQSTVSVDPQLNARRDQ